MLRRLSVASSVLFVLMGLGVSDAQAAAVSDHTAGTWMVNGPVRAIAKVGDTVWMGGQFTELREKPVGVGGGKVVNVQNLAAVSATTGQPVAGLNIPAVGGPSNAIVYSLEAVGTRLFVGGNFTSVASGQVSNLVELDGSTGQLTGFRPSVGLVLALGHDATSSTQAVPSRASTVRGGITWRRSISATAVSTPTGFPRPTFGRAISRSRLTIRLCS